MKKRRIAALFLTITMLTGMLPTSAFAADSNQTTISEGSVSFDKTAAWDDEQHEKATVTLTVNGTPRIEQVSHPSNVIFVMDVSGSMKNLDIACPLTEEEHKVANQSFQTAETNLYWCPVSRKSGNSVNATHERINDSYNPNRMGHVRYQANIFAQDILKADSQNQVAIVTFSSDDYEVQDKSLVQEFTNDSKKLEDAINGINHDEGNTSYNYAFMAADAMFEKLDAKRKEYPTSVVFLTDGDPSTEYGVFLNGVEQAKKLRDKNVTIYGLGFSADVTDRGIQNIYNVVSQPGKDFAWKMTDSQQLADILSKIHSSITSTPAASNVTMTDVIGDKFFVDEEGIAALAAQGATYDPATKTVTWFIKQTTGEDQALKIPVKVEDEYKNTDLKNEPTNKGDASIKYTDVDGKEKTQTAVPPVLDRPADPASTFTITYDKNAEDAKGEVDAQTVVKNDSATVTTQTYTREGYTQIGWAKTAGATEVDYAAGGEIASVTDNMTLYAVWQKVEGYSLTIKQVYPDNRVEEGPLITVGQDGTIKNAVIEPEEGYVLKDFEFHGNNSLSFSKEDNVLSGKLKDKTVTGTFNYERDPNLWYHVVYKGGSTDVTGTKTALIGNPAELEQVKKDEVEAQYPNFRLIDWYDANNKLITGNTVTLAKGAQENVYPVTAHWQAKVIFDTQAVENNGTISNGKDTYSDPNVDKNVIFPVITITNTEKYKGGHWELNKTTVDDKNEPIVNGNKYTYVLEENDKYTLTFANGEHGTVTGGTFTDSYSGKTVEAIVGSELPEVTPAEGYEFTGWKAQGSNDVKTFDQIKGDKITADTTYTAQYKLKEYTINVQYYEENVEQTGWELIENKTEKLKLNYGDTFTIGDGADINTAAPTTHMEFEGVYPFIRTIPTPGTDAEKMVLKQYTVGDATPLNISVFWNRKTYNLNVVDYFDKELTDSQPYTLKPNRKIITAAEGKILSDASEDRDFNNATSTKPLAGYKVTIEGTPQDGVTSKQNEDGSITLGGKLTKATGMVKFIHSRDLDKWYDVTYEANNGTGKTYNEKDIVRIGTDYTVLAPDNAKVNFATPGYIFDGWTVTNGTYNAETGMLTAVDKDVTLTANWKADVTFKGNNGGTVSDDGKTSYANPAKDGLQFPTTLTPNRGYTEVGGRWTDSNNNTVTTSTKPIDGETYTYQFVEIDKITVSFASGEHGSISGGASSIVGYPNETLTDAATADGNKTLPTITPNTGYTHTGWRAEGAETTVTQDALGNEIITKNVTYTAVYTPNPHTVTFNPNGGKIETTDPTATADGDNYVYNVKYDDKDFSKSLTAKKTDSSNFAGWSTDANAVWSDTTKVVKNPVTIATITGDVVYYAIYAPAVNIQVNFYEQDSKGEYVKTTDGKVISSHEGGSYTIGKTNDNDINLSASSAYLNTGVAYGEDATTKPATGALNEGEQQVTANSTRVVSVFFDRKSYTVTVEEKEMQNTPNTSVSDTKLAESEGSYSSTEPVPGYKVEVTIDGDKTATDALKTTLNENGSQTVTGPILGDVTITFTHVKDDSEWFTITYNAKNKENQTKEIADQVIGTVHNVLAFDSAALDFNGGGYSFVKWVSSGRDYLPTEELPALIGNVTLDAVWQANVSFDADGGTVNDDGKTDYNDPAQDGFVQFPTITPDKDHEGTGSWWEADENGKPTTEITDPTKVPVKDGDEFVFVCDEKGKIKVVFDAAAHGTMADGKPTAEFADKKYDLTLGQIIGSEDAAATAQPTVTAAEGWTLEGWYAAAGAKLTDEDLTKVTGAKAGDTVTYTARYTAKVTLDPNGGELPGDQDPTLQVPDGDKLPEIKPPTKEDGSDFEGWFDKDGNEYIPGETPVDKPLDLIARYSKLTISKEHAVEHKGAEHTGVRIGDVVNYTVTVKNEGDKTATNVTVKDSMFDGRVSEVSVKVGEAAAQTIKPQGGVVTLGEVAAKAAATVTYSYTVAEADEGKTISNTAVLSADGKQPTEDKTETERVETRQEIKLYYAVETFNADGSATTAPTVDSEGVVIAKRYPGETLTKEEIIAAIQSNVEPKLDAASINLDGRVLSVNGGKAEAEIRDYTVLDGQIGGKNNKLIAAYPLRRHTLTYQPGANGSLALGENAKGEKQPDGSVVFTVPHGAVPYAWFGNASNGTLNVDVAGNEGFLFNGWDSNLDMTLAITENKVITAAWRSNKLSFKVEMYVDGKLAVTRNDVGILENADLNSATVKLNAATLLQEEQAKNTISQGFKFKSFTQDGTETTANEQTFTVTDQGVIRVDYVPYGLTVWHEYDTYKINGGEQDITAPVQVKADTSVFNLTRMKYSSTEVYVNGVLDTSKTYTDVVDIPMDNNSYVVTFKYYRESDSSGGGSGGGGGGTGGGSGGGGGGTGGGGGVDITNPEIPLAPGLNTDDHFAYVIGYPDGTVRPNNQISRQEVATIFFRLLTDDSRLESWSQSNTFSDVSKTAWSNNAISTMTNAEILTGYPNGTFRPTGNITRAEFAAIAARFDSALYVGEDKFSDISGHWAAKYINRAAEKGWLSGYEDGTFRPDAYITRAEAMTMINNVLDRRVRVEGLHAEMKMWTDCNPNDWFYLAVQEATNTHDYDRANPTENETWSAILPARDWVALEKEWSQAAGAQNSPAA